VENMAFRALILLAVMILSNADAPFPAATGAPQPQSDEGLSQALSTASRTMTDVILSNPVINIVSLGSPTLPLDDVSLRVDNIALVHLTNLQLRSSPLHMTSAIPDLELSSLILQGRISNLEVTGNYSISVEIMNHTSLALITSDKGSLILTFQNTEVSGHIGLDLKENSIQCHTEDLLYRPNEVALKIYYKDGRGFPRVTEEKRSSVQGRLEEPIYRDLTKSMNRIIQQELNRMMRNVTITALTGNSPATERSFKSSAKTETENLNDFIDGMLNITKENTTGQISIPDFENSFEKKLGLISIRGYFKAEGGWLKCLETIHRTADATLKRVNNTIEVSATMGFKVLRFGYERYEFGAQLWERQLCTEIEIILKLYQWTFLRNI
jgi:hypothetical protein